MFDLIVKLFLTPENIIGIIFNTLNILTFCFIFKELKEKWWKSLIPIYNTYILYKHLWKYKWLCLIQIVCSFINARSLYVLKHHLIKETFNVIQEYVGQKNIDFNINFLLLTICIICFIITYIIVFIFKRISYWKINNLLNSNLFFKIATLIFPELFLFISYCFYKHKKEKINDK